MLTLPTRSLNRARSDSARLRHDVRVLHHLAPGRSVALWRVESSLEKGTCARDAGDGGARPRHCSYAGRGPGRLLGLGATEHLGGSSMPTATTRQLLRRHAVAFAIAFVSLTTYLLTNYAIKRVPEMRARGVPTGTVVEFVLLAVPFTAAMTIPLGVFLAVLWVFTRLGAKGMLAAARGERHGVRRLVTPVLWAAAAVAALMLVFND